MRHALLLSLSLAACTSFDSLDRGICGNGLIEPGEDCDSNDPGCVRCAVTCDEATDCPSAAYACGTDGLCHAPGGTLAPPASAGPFQVNEFRITDVGHDGAGDVVGLSRTSIVVRDGAASGVLDKGVSVVTPFQTGRPAFGDLDGDGSQDITLTTPDGLVSYTAPLGELTPLPVQSRLGADSPFDLTGLYYISPAALGAYIASTDDRVLIAVFDFGNPMRDAVVLPCGLSFRASTFDDRDVEIYRLSTDTDPTAELIMAITAETVAGATKTCVTAITKPNNGAGTIADITPATAVNLTGRPVLADLDFDADRCPDLISANSAGVFKRWDGSRSGACGLAAAAVNLPAIPAAPSAKLLGRFPLVPGVLATANDLLVMSDGLYAYTILGFYRIYTSTRSIGRVEPGDINGDGAIDAVVSSEGEDDIDVLYRTPNAGYQLVRLDTASRVTSLTVADYDGNGIADIAYTELLENYQRLEVAFCTTDRPLDPVAVGAFPSNISIVRLQIPDSVDQQALAADLAVLSIKNGNRPTTVSLLHGSPQRTMLPYYDSTPDSTNAFDGRKPFVFHGAVIGQFAGSDTLPDVAGIGVPLQGHRDTMPTTPSRAWVMKGTVVGPDATPTDGTPVMGLVDCNAPQALAGLCVDDALYMPWTAGGRDQVIAVDRAEPPHAAVVDPAGAGTSIAAMTATALLAKIPAGSVVRSSYAVDLAGDGTLELLASFAPRTTGPGAVLTCTMTGALPGACTDLVPELLGKVEGATACLDAAPARVHYRDPFTADSGGAELVVLCRGGGSSMLERVRFGESGLEVEELSRVPEQLEALRIGDVTGDGIDDVAALASDHGAETLEVFRQCSSRDASVCRGGGQ